MLEVLIAIAFVAIISLIAYKVKITIMVNRFIDDVDFVIILEEELFSEDDFFAQEEIGEIRIEVGSHDYKSNNYSTAVKELKDFTEKALNQYEEINNLTNLYDFTDYEEKLNYILYETRNWIWKHDCSSDDDNIEQK